MGALLVLWDVDNTLIHNGGVSKEAYARGFEILTGRAPVLPVITDGQTDPAIMRSLLQRHGIEVTEEIVARIPEAMRIAMESLVPRLRERGHALSGAREAIDALGRHPGVIQSVLTGNIAPNGYSKLATFDLDAGLDFDVGGFGSDHEVRAELVEVARRRAAAKYAIAVNPTDIVLIGDTPRDVEAGRLSGAYVVGVATGVFDEQRLAAEGADIVLPDLVDTVHLVDAVLGARRRSESRLG